jgi:ATP-dependent 26S proteasome regulatory subunit
MSQVDIHLKHLQTELVRIDVLIQQQVKRWRQSGQNPNDQFRGLHITDTQIDGLLARPFGSNWGQSVNLDPESAQKFDDLENKARLAIQMAEKEAQRRGIQLRLLQLAENFNLSPFELDILLICIAPALDVRYERIYGYLQDDITRKRPSPNLILDLLQPPGLERLNRLSYFSEDAPLVQYHLVEYLKDPQEPYIPLINQTLAVDDTLVLWLLGDYKPHPQLKNWSEIIPVALQPDPTDQLLAKPVWEEINLVLDQNPILMFYGPDQASQQAAARLCAQHIQKPLLSVNLGAAASANHQPLTLMQLALRDCLLTGAVPYFYGWDACISETGYPLPGLAQTCTQFNSLVITSAQSAWQFRDTQSNKPIYYQNFAHPNYNQRLALWEHYLQASSGTNLGLEELASQFILSSEQIRDSAAAAFDIARRQNHDLTKEDLFLSARTHSNPRLASLAHKITPRYAWADIILPDDQHEILNEIVAMVRSRPTVLENWGIGRKLVSSAGVTVLFAGPPGTGKTMAAEVIAAELGLDLYKIDLSTIVSKYVGETEKNLEKIFNEAQSSNAILFFDEADAVFGKRSEVKDAHDRYANIEISYLLQRMEAYDGITILATNLRANLDEAFTRRLQFVIDFPFPDEAERLHIWKSLFPTDIPRADDLDLELLARRFKIAGGNIRNVIVGAAYLAASAGQPIGMKHLMHAIRREFQKMGKLIKEKDLLSE